MANKSKQSKIQVPMRGSESLPTTAPDHASIALLAYLHWQNRGCPIGSPEEDWIKAETELQRIKN